MSDINIVLENRDDIHVAVEEKDINVEVPAGKDGRALHPRGEWSASVAYAYLDLVSYDGSSYVALKAVPAGTLPTNTSYWMLSAEKGEPGGAVWGNITGDLSDQTDLQDALDAKAPVILSSASGSIASFSDGSASPVTALSVAIEPVQDLHGYDNPWPAGGGKNLLKPPTSGATIKGVTFTVNSDGTITANGGTSTGDADFYFVGAQGVYESANIPTGNYIVTGNSGATNVTTIHIVKKTGGEVICTQNANIPVSVSLDENEQYRIFIRVHNGKTVTNQKYYPMIRLASVSDATYAPYSNICPISGHTSATVTRTGKNLFSYEEFFDSWVEVPNSKTGRLCLKLKGNTYYTVSTNVPKTTTGNLNASVFAWAGDYNSFAPSTATNGVSLEVSRTIKTNADGKLTIAMYTLEPNSGYTMTETDFSNGTYWIQIELGSTPSAYEPYQGTSLTIDLDGTRYGGTLDVLTGEMIVEYGIYTFSGNEQWVKQGGTTTGEKYYTSAYLVADAKKPANNGLSVPIQTSIGNFNISYNLLNYQSTYEMCIAADGRFGINEYLKQDSGTLAGVQVVYELADYITVQLSPSQLSTLLGTNNLWADTGDVAVEYRADTKLFVQGQIAQTAKVTRQMIADSATADGKAPKSLATGDLIIVGDELRKATANIGNGSAITASNSTTATLADVIKALQ